MDIGDTPATHHSYQQSIKEQLRMGLNALPAPKNDYEIVVPEHEEEQAKQEQMQMVEDQADVDARALEMQKEQAAKELAKRSQVIQRELPR